MGKIIIDNLSDLPDRDVIKYVASVMAEGRISNNGKQYCCHSVFADGVQVSAALNKKSDKFTVYQAPNKTPSD